MIIRVYSRYLSICHILICIKPYIMLCCPLSHHLSPTRPNQTTRPLDQTSSLCNTSKLNNQNTRMHWLNQSKFNTSTNYSFKLNLISFNCSKHKGNRIHVNPSITFYSIFSLQMNTKCIFFSVLYLISHPKPKETNSKQNQTIKTHETKPVNQII